MMALWAGAAQTPRSAARVSVNLHQATAGQDCYGNSMPSTTVRSVHYTCDPSSAFLLGMAIPILPQKRSDQWEGKISKLLAIQLCLVSRPSCSALGTLGIGAGWGMELCF